MIAIIKYTLIEALSKKIILFFFLVSTFVIVALSLILGLTSVQTLTGSKELIVNNELISNLVKQIQTLIIIPLYGGGIFISIFSAAGFIPSMLEKGFIDLLLSKPITRTQLLISKCLGVVLIILLNVSYLVISIWIIIGLKFNVWNFYFLFTIVSIMISFIAFFSITTLVGVTLKSSVLAMIFAYLVYFIISPVLFFFNGLSKINETMSPIVKSIITFLYYLFPQSDDISKITIFIAQGNSVDNFLPLITTLIWSIIIFTISVIVFNKKDF